MLYFARNSIVLPIRSFNPIRLRDPTLAISKAGAQGISIAVAFRSFDRTLQVGRDRTGAVPYKRVCLPYVSTRIGLIHGRQPVIMWPRQDETSKESNYAYIANCSATVYRARFH